MIKSTDVGGVYSKSYLNTPLFDADVAMKLFKYFSLSFLLLICLGLSAQTDSTQLPRLQEFMQNIYSFNRLYPQEKVWLHCDNTAYFQGDTIWFAAYVTSAETLRPAENLSKILYVELLNEAGEVLSTQRLQIVDGHCHGQIPLNTELERHFVNDRIQHNFYPINRRTGNFCIPLPSGYYEVRAYTRAMLNWGTDICFSRVFPVFDAPEYEGDYSRLTMKNKEKKHPELIENKIRPKTEEKERMNVEFYPEGGNIINGLPCRVAYKVTDKEGRELTARCRLLGDGKLVARSETRHDGMGCFSFLPQEEVRYKLYVETDDRERTFDLPDAQSQGLMLAVDATGADSVRMAMAATDSLLNKPIGMSITCRGKLLQFNVYDRLPNRPMRIPAIANNILLPGVNQVTLFDAVGRVYAERLFFVHDTTVVGKQLVENRLDKEGYKPFEKINLTLQSRRGGSLQFASLSVRDGSAEIVTNYADNLQTYLLLSSDLKGYIHHPDYYFEVDDSVHRTALDLLMMTQGWRRYAWKQLAGTEEFKTSHVIEDGLVLQGQVKHPDRKNKYLKGINVGATVSNGKIVEQNGSCMTDNEGKFSFKIKPFTGRQRLSLNITDGRKRLVDGKILLDRHFSPNPREFLFVEKDILSAPLPPQAATDSFSFAGNNLLTGIKVKRSKPHFEPFTLHNIKEEWEKALDIDDEDFMSYSVEEYIYDRYNIAEEILWGYVIAEGSVKEEEYQEHLNREDGLFIKTKRVNLYYLDYIQVYANAFSHTRIMWAKGVNLDVMDNCGPRRLIMCDTYRKPKPVMGLRTTHIDGYSEVIDYYHPQYNREIIPGEVDYRRTLYWNPCVELNEEGKVDIMFYNNGTCKRPTISIETLHPLTRD